MATKSEMEKLQANFHKKMLSASDIRPGKTIKVKSIGNLLLEKEQRRRKRR